MVGVLSFYIYNELALKVINSIDVMERFFWFLSGTISDLVSPVHSFNFYHNTQNY